RGHDAVETFNERFGCDVLMAIKRAKIDRERSCVVLLAVLVQPVKLRVLSAMDDRVLRELRFGFLLDYRTGRFIAGFFSTGNVDALLRLVPDTFDGRLFHFR